MALDPEVAAVVAAFRRTNDGIRRRVLAYVERAWLGLDNYRDEDINVFAATVARVVEGGQVQVAALTDAYLAAIERAVRGNPVQPIGVRASIVSTEALRGIAANELWHRPGLAVWNSLSEGQDLTASVTHGLNRAREITETNLQLAKTHTTRHVFGKKAYIQGYRRVPQGAESCGLCLVASTQRYHRKKLMPIHPGCDCAVYPLYSSRDPGQVIEPDQLDAVHDQIAQTFGISDRGARDLDYRKVIVEHEHGEIGPVLVKRGQSFTGPADLPTRPDRG